MSGKFWLLIGEGVDNVEAGKKLLEVVCGVPLGNIKMLAKDRGEILKKLGGYLKHQGKLLIIIDLEGERCAPELLRKCGVDSIPTDKCVRVAVRMIEKWVLTDVDGFSQFFQVECRRVLSLVRNNADAISHAKREVVNLCSNSRKKAFRKVMVGQNRYGTGPLYSKILRDFIREAWSPTAAAQRSPSLQKTIDCLRRLCP